MATRKLTIKISAKLMRDLAKVSEARGISPEAFAATFVEKAVGALTLCSDRHPVWAHISRHPVDGHRRKPPVPRNGHYNHEERAVALRAYTLHPSQKILGIKFIRERVADIGLRDAKLLYELMADGGRVVGRW